MGFGWSSSLGTLSSTFLAGDFSDELEEELADLCSGFTSLGTTGSLSLCFGLSALPGWGFGDFSLLDLEELSFDLSDSLSGILGIGFPFFPDELELMDFGLEGISCAGLFELSEDFSFSGSIGSGFTGSSGFEIGLTGVSF